jgi:hypothetical protein
MLCRPVGAAVQFEARVRSDGGAGLGREEADAVFAETVAEDARAVRSAPIAADHHAVVAHGHRPCRGARCPRRAAPPRRPARPTCRQAASSAAESSASSSGTPAEVLDARDDRNIGDAALHTRARPVRGRRCRPGRRRQRRSGARRRSSLYNVPSHGGLIGISASQFRDLQVIEVARSRLRVRSSCESRCAGDRVPPVRRGGARSPATRLLVAAEAAQVALPSLSMLPGGIEEVVSRRRGRCRRPGSTSRGVSIDRPARDGDRRGVDARARARPTSIRDLQRARAARGLLIGDGDPSPGSARSPSPPARPRSRVGQREDALLRVARAREDQHRRNTKRLSHRTTSSHTKTTHHDTGRR